MTDSEKALLAELEEARGEVTALAVLCERYRMALEAASACIYESDVEAVVRLALERP